jgi:hypothetical protein
MTTAAAEQDDLLPRTIEDDIALGRSRLLRARLLTGAGVATAAAAVAGIVVAGTVIADHRSARDDGAPVATNSPIPSATQSAPKATTPVNRGPRSWAGKDFGPVLRAALVRHLDPGKDHLVLDNEPIGANGQPGLRLAAVQIGWRIAGQPGMGRIWLELADSERAIGKVCGFNRIATTPFTCHDVPLGSGRTARVGHRGDEWEVGYVRPDGSVVYAYVSKLFHQNTTIPIHDIGITQDQLLALVQDESLRLSPLSPSEQAEKERLFAFKPSTDAMYAAMERIVGGRLTGSYKEFVPEQAMVGATRQVTGSTAKQDIAVSIDVKSMVSSCQSQIQVACNQKVTLADGRVAWYGEDAAAGRMGVRYEQPDGDMAFVVVVGAFGAPGGVTRNQIYALVTDPALNDTN